MTNSYGIHNHFKAGKTYSWAQYVDKRKNGGNGNVFVDGNESKTFIDIMKHRYGFDYSFNKKDSEQSDAIYSLEGKVENENIKKNLYLDGSRTIRNDYGEDSTIWEFSGAVNLGYRVGGALDNYTTANGKKFVKNVMKEAAEYPVTANKRKVLKDILFGYNVNGGRNGFFEQLGTEYGSKEAFTNGEVLNFLKAIMDCIPEKERYCDDFGTIQKFYDEYSQRDPNEIFENHGFWNGVGRMFGCDKLDNLDEAVMNVL